ncbi:hypothetical protein TNCV_1832011 [Trichonephila clavipes]|nr:hypothetical protein TNCV_1832011 [Trichonephila clavipes]
MFRLVYFVHANVFQRRRTTVPIEVALVPLHDCRYNLLVFAFTVDHSKLPMTSKNWRTNREFHSPSVQHT